MRWGTALHDRFMLPHFVWADFLEVLDDLRGAGYDFDPAWFEAQREFRFPVHGEIAGGGVKLEMRHALEPWHVMGETGAIGGTVRYVDSSTERLQVRADRADPERHVIACNGRARADDPDRRGGRRRWPACATRRGQPAERPAPDDAGACAADLRHPRYLEQSLARRLRLSRGASRRTQLRDVPVNGYEAEARRKARFQEHGHSPGRRAMPAEEAPGEFPLTLDLRRRAACWLNRRTPGRPASLRARRPTGSTNIRPLRPPATCT